MMTHDDPAVLVDLMIECTFNLSTRQGREGASTLDSLVEPDSATLSSTKPDFPAENCIDGETDGPAFDENSKTGKLCHTEPEVAPWIALHYNTPVIVQRVKLFNRIDCCGDRTKNVQVRISNELPSSGSEMFTGGFLFGRFDGPATNGQHIVITGKKQLSIIHW